MSNDNTPTDPRRISLSDGRELRLDLNQLTWLEVEKMVVMPFKKHEDPDQARAEFIELLGHAVGMSTEEISGLGFEDFARVRKAVFRFIKDPVGTDPN